jgi:hypothetical protein
MTDQGCFRSRADHDVRRRIRAVTASTCCRDTRNMRAQNPLTATFAGSLLGAGVGRWLLVMEVPSLKLVELWTMATSCHGGRGPGSLQDRCEIGRGLSVDQAPPARAALKEVGAMRCGSARVAHSHSATPPWPEHIPPWCWLKLYELSRHFAPA